MFRAHFHRDAFNDVLGVSHIVFDDNRHEQAKRL